MKKYIVKIPNPDTNEIEERIFYNLEELTKFLGISSTVAYSIINDKYAFVKNSHLRGIKITKEEINKNEKMLIRDKKELEKKDLEKIKEFQRQLLSKK
jgi:hypothetical protein